MTIRGLPIRAIAWALLGIGAIAVSLQVSGLFQQDIFNPNGWPQVWRFLAASLHPDLSADLLRLTAEAALKTFAYAVCGTVLSLLLGLIGGVVGSEVWWEAVLPAVPPFGWWRRAAFLGLRVLLSIPRALHELIWGLLFVNLWGLDPLTGVLAIAIPFGAITAKVFSELLDETPRQPFRVLLNSGVAVVPAFLYGLLPQAALNLVSYSFYRFECSLRSAAVLGLIGAGGLGYEILLSLQSLKYEQLWTFFYTLIALTGCVDFASAWMRQQLGCPSRLDLNLRKQERTATDSAMNRLIGSDAYQPSGSIERLPSQRSFFRSFFMVLSIVLIAYCFGVVQADFSKLWTLTTWQRLAELGRACFPPDRQVVAQLGSLSIQTIAMSVLAIGLAAGVGSLLAFPAASDRLQTQRSNQVGPKIRILLARAVLLVCRAIPAPIWALVLLFVMLPGILPGAIGLGIHNLGILGRLKAEVIENLDDRPLTALSAQGASSAQVFLYGTLPLTTPRFLAYDLYRWDVCMRETVIVGLVGAAGLGRVLTEQLSSFDYPGLVVTLSGFWVLTFAVDWVSALLRRSLR